MYMNKKTTSSMKTSLLIFYELVPNSELDISIRISESHDINEYVFKHHIIKK